MLCFCAYIIFPSHAANRDIVGCVTIEVHITTLDDPWGYQWYIAESRVGHVFKILSKDEHQCEVIDHLQKTGWWLTCVLCHI